MTRNRVEARHRPQEGDGSVGRTVGVILTLFLLAPAAALLASRLRGIIDLEQFGCGGAGVLGPVVHLALPAVVLIVAIPAALASLTDRARGWAWLLVALLGTAVIDLALRQWLPGCL